MVTSRFACGLSTGLLAVAAIVLVGARPMPVSSTTTFHVEHGARAARTGARRRTSRLPRSRRPPHPRFCGRRRPSTHPPGPATAPVRRRRRSRRPVRDRDRRMTPLLIRPAQPHRPHSGEQRDPDVVMMEVSATETDSPALRAVPPMNPMRDHPEPGEHDRERHPRHHRRLLDRMEPFTPLVAQPEYRPAAWEASPFEEAAAACAGVPAGGEEPELGSVIIITSERRRR